VLARRYPLAPARSLPPRPGAGAASQEVWGSAPPGPTEGRGRAAGLSGCWGTLVDVRRVLGPRQDPEARLVTASGRGPSARSHGGLTARSLISGLDSTAFALAVYASSSGLPRPTQDSLPAACQALPGGIGYPQGSGERFPIARPPFPTYPDARTTKLTCRGRLQVRHVSENQHGGPGQVVCSFLPLGPYLGQGGFVQDARKSFRSGEARPLAAD
jgi:hypothetical protein